MEVAWQSPQSEYRPTEYLQWWARFWFDDDKRLQAAKKLQQARLDRIRAQWLDNRRLREAGFEIEPARLTQLLDASLASLAHAPDHASLLTEEARLSKQLFRLAAQATAYGEFTRAKRGGAADPANRFLDHGNYLAYGLGATATWVLGLPHSLAILHGKTRHGGLVFDAADLVKDATILPQAFLSAMKGDDEQTFRQQCIEQLTRSEALDFMIDQLQRIAEQLGRDA